MADIPDIPPPVPDGGSNSNGFSTEKILKELQDCGVNTTTLNMSSILSMDSSQQILYLERILELYNCSSGNSSLEPTIPSVVAKPHVILVVYFATVMVLGLMINLCVIGTICRARRLRTITNCFVLSLSLADLLMAAVVVPLKIKELYQQQLITSAPFLDTLFPILGVASLLNLCAVTLDRYFTITNPLTYEARVNSRQAGLIIASIWLVSTAQELVHFAVSSRHEQLFQVIRFVIVFSIPFICVMFVNTKIYCIARGHARQIRANEPGQMEGRSFSRKMKTAQVIGLLVGTFILAWLPYFIITIYEQFQEENVTRPKDKQNALDVGKMVTASLACSTALFNPLLYGFLRKEVRYAIIKGLKCQNVNQSDVDTTVTAENTARRMEITRK